ncbi:molybdopterin-guanine dinucleotide biosynthesis protein B [Chloroflexota bacterium]
MPPIVLIVGRSKSGKTTLIEKLVPELKSRGYRVAAVKHAVHSLNLDDSGKDSWRYAQAGSDAVAMISTDKIVLIMPKTGAFALDQIARLLGEDCDIILAEGFKQSNVSKVQVHRKEVGPLFSSVTKVMAIVTNEYLETNKRQFAPDDIKGLVDLLERGFLKKGASPTQIEG